MYDKEHEYTIFVYLLEQTYRAPLAALMRSWLPRQSHE